MSARERMLTLRLLDRMYRHPVWVDRLGIAASQEMVDVEAKEEPP